MPTLTIASLGEFQLWRDLVPISNDAWPTQKCKSLFKILLSARGQLVTADQLMEWLWPDLAPTKARNNLWVAVSQARRILEPDLPPRGASSFLISTDAGYRLALGEDVQWDVTAFLDASARAKAISSHASHEEHLAILEEARACYNGDYLVEDRYEEWALSLREELQRRYLQLLLELGECYAQVGRYEDAVTQARAVLVREVAAEPAYQALMRYAYYLGDQRTALQAYDACVRALRSELDATPLEATTEL